MPQTTSTVHSKEVERPIFEQISGTEHEQISFCYDKDSGLKSIIAIHNTVLGPSLGGTRFWNYTDENQAVKDVLRLSRGMTYKAAITGLNLGGGKAVIIGDSRKDKSEMLFRRYGKFVNGLNGRYITAEDVGTGTRDMEYIALETKYVTGKPESMGGSGDPSPITAYTTFLGIKASAKEVWGKDNLEGKTVGVQGAGNVGENLIKLLLEAGAKIIVTDVYEDRLKEITKKYKVTVVGPEEIYDAKMDIYAPCALGATINDDTLNRLTCAIIAGSANNQLEDEHLHGKLLKEKGFLYAPDFLINAGGLINVYMEWVGYNKDRVLSAAEKVYDRTLEIFKVSHDENISTHAAALRLAEKRIHDVAKLKARL